ncbi:hypothetical protein DLD77_10545 [Chitinophaga alhagiae]|uniref:Uncharacterized protein n=1 Tax=Chitinophaga alhagiae TaxID=2203219 RepID=A0ABM6WDQ6_9BACT|nr:hypothetical protein DLD77_10545 [Chitinophaga alhagiae]
MIMCFISSLKFFALNDDVKLAPHTGQGKRIVRNGAVKRALSQIGQLADTRMYCGFQGKGVLKGEKR